MSVDIVKQLERAKRYIEKNQLNDAIDTYQTVLTAVPNHLESIQALGDLYTRRSQPERAARYYGILFDRFTGPREEAKALALYGRYLKSQQQPPERVARYAAMLQNQNRAEDAIEQFTSAALAFELTGKGDDALASFVRIAQLDPENRERHVAVGELAERLGNLQAAVKAYLRAGQLSSEDGGSAIEWFAKAHNLLPKDRSAALLYAQGLLRKGEAAQAVALLVPLAETEKDTPYLETYAEALMRSGQLDEARAVLEHMTNQGSGSADKFFALTSEYMRANQDHKAVSLLAAMKKSMLAAHRETEFAAGVDHLVGAYPSSLPLAEFCATMYAELNREAKYFDATVLLFDLYLANNQLEGACASLQKLVDIDPYDPRNQKRLDLLQGRAGEPFLSRMRTQLMKAATHGSLGIDETTSTLNSDEPTPALLEEVRAEQTLEDLLVQTEIFIQYSLQSKAIERLQKIAELFPKEAARNERLKGLFEAVHWWPQTAAAESTPEAPATLTESLPPVRSELYAPETLHDLAKISEINQNVFRQPSPRAMLSVAVNDVGNYLHATRCLAVMRSPGQPPQMASEYCAPGVEGSLGAQVVKLIAQIERATPDSLGGLPLSASTSPALKEMGLEAVMGVNLTDPETHALAGMLIVGFSSPHNWKPNETYFLQSIGDQMLLCVHHTRLRSLVRTLAATDEKTGLLTRGSYLDCLLNESQRARTQGRPLALALLQIDGGPDLLRQQGEALLERHMEQLGRAVQSIVRQTDLAIKYTSWALAFVLPDTPLPGARLLAEKLRKTAQGLRAPWEGAPVTMSVAVAEAMVRQDYDNEDIVTDLINRAEFALDEARKRGGNEIVSMETSRS